ncbi:MAG TPA: amidase, partial [Thermodesulfobacteriota bacterium]|nr:amidase [Thermodesulfobacteriota bacterium]
NAVIHRMYDQGRETARYWDSAVQSGKIEGAVFCGVPFLLKDLVAEYKGAPFHEGCRAVKGYVSKLDTELVRRQKAGGLVILGKTNTPEFGALPTTEPLLYGPTHNPWDPALTPGGSSGGSAAAVAAGIVPMAHGNDGGGSIRIPASCCGVFGLKPTRGRNPLGPLFGDMGSGIVHEHAVTRTVRDSAALLDLTSGPDIGDPYCAPPRKRPFLEEAGMPPGRLKIGFLTGIPEGWSDRTNLHPDCADALKDAARLCADLGHSVEEVDPRLFSHPNVVSAFGFIFSCFLAHCVAYWGKELGKNITRDELEPITWERYQASLARPAGDYPAVVEEVQRFSRKVAIWYHDGGYDMLLTPTMAIPPTKLGAFAVTPEAPTKWVESAFGFTAFTRVFNMTGQPAMSVPLFWNKNNVPIGAQFAGRFGAEGTLFRLAAQLEEARPWKSRKPPNHCDNA